MTLENDPECQKLGIVGYSWINLAMGIVERLGIWDCDDDVIVEVSVGVWFLYLVLPGESSRVSLSLAWRRHATSFPIYGMRRFVFLAAFSFSDDGNFPLWWQKIWPQWKAALFSSTRWI